MNKLYSLSLQIKLANDIYVDPFLEELLKQLQKTQVQTIYTDLE